MQYLVVDYDGHTFAPIGEGGGWTSARLLRRRRVHPTLQAVIYLDEQLVLCGQHPGEEFRGMMSLPRRLLKKTGRRPGAGAAPRHRGRLFERATSRSTAGTSSPRRRWPSGSSRTSTRARPPGSASTSGSAATRRRAVDGCRNQHRCVDHGVRPREGWPGGVPPESPDFAAAEAAADLDPQDIGAAHPAPLRTPAASWRCSSTSPPWRCSPRTARSPSAT